MAKIFSLDAEVDGLYGVAFAIAVTIREDGVEIASFVGRVPDSVVTDDWVQKKVLPAIAAMPITHDSSESLEEALWDFWKSTWTMQNKDELKPDPSLAVIAHCGSPVESGLFRRCVERDPSRSFSAPFPLHEVGTALLLKGEDATSVDAYNKKHELTVPFDGVSHHPMYDAVAAAVAWENLIK